MNDTTNFNLATADKHQLKYWANEQYGLTLSLAMGEATMRDHIVAHCAKNDIEAPVGEMIVKDTGDKKKYVTINIAKTQDKKDRNEPVFLGHQGIAYTVPRGIDIKVPYFLVEVLKNAIQDIVTQDPDTGAMLHEDLLSYPFQIIHDPNKKAA